MLSQLHVAARCQPRPGTTLEQLLGALAWEVARQVEGARVTRRRAVGEAAVQGQLAERAVWRRAGAGLPGAGERLQVLVEVLAPLAAAAW